MMSAWQYAEIGPFTSSPAAQLASSETVILCSPNVLLTTTQVTTPAIAMMTPTTMAVSAATFRMASPAPPGGARLQRWMHLRHRSFRLHGRAASPLLGEVVVSQVVHDAPSLGS